MSIAAQVVLTGLSGAGKQLAAICFEDMGWRVMENLPPLLLPQALAAVEGTSVCIVSDVRSGQIESLLPALEPLPSQPVLVFLDASDEELLKRFKETRRPHPLFFVAEGILPAIAHERQLLAPLKARADVVIDTTGLAPADLRAHLAERFASPTERAARPLTITVASFGFKHGTPLDADLLFDVRFLSNPYYVEELRALDGRNEAVEAHVMGDERTAAFLERLYDLVGFSLPHYLSEGKAYLTIGIGCTGGKHRSVVIAEKLSCFLSERGYRVLTQHRDVERR